MRSRPTKAQLDTWMSDLETSLPSLANDYESLWISDHFFWNDIPTLEVWTALTYMAARWPGFKVGPMVLGQSYRNPALLAKMGATLQNLTGGRFIMGLGAGWKEDEYHAYNYPFPDTKTRLEQLEEAAIIAKAMWSSRPATFVGKHYSIHDAYCEPQPRTPIPLLI